MLYKINGHPLGITIPRSAFEVIQNIPVQARKVGNKIIVAKIELVQKLRGINDSWADFWNNAKDDKFEFEEKN